MSEVLTQLQQADQAITEAENHCNSAIYPLQEARQEDARLAGQMAQIDLDLRQATTSQGIREAMAELDRLKGEREIQGRLIGNLETELKRREGVIRDLRERRGELVDRAVRLKEHIQTEEARIRRQEQELAREQELLNNKRHSLEMIRQGVAEARAAVKAITGETLT